MYEAEDPAEVKRSGAENVDRSQGVARGISVRLFFALYLTRPK